MGSTCITTERGGALEGDSIRTNTARSHGMADTAAETGD